jgi:hypothetical protein
VIVSRGPADSITFLSQVGEIGKLIDDEHLLPKLPPWFLVREVERFSLVIAHAAE